jgi:DNA invertase Pin-like site-specific DNA recombinase
MLIGYVRVSTSAQSAESQKSVIARYVVEQRWTLDEWIEVELSSRRRLPELLAKVSAHDTVVVAELSRLGRSLREVLAFIEELIQHKQCRLILVKQGLDLDPQNHRNMTHKILLTIFAMLAELERDFVSERTKEGLRARQERGVVLGKPKGVVQGSMYDVDRERILHLHALGVPLATIVRVHLGYGRYLSLKNYVTKLQRARPATGPAA